MSSEKDSKRKLIINIPFQESPDYNITNQLRFFGLFYDGIIEDENFNEKYEKMQILEYCIKLSLYGGLTENEKCFLDSDKTDGVVNKYSKTLLKIIKTFYPNAELKDINTKLLETQMKMDEETNNLIKKYFVYKVSENESKKIVDCNSYPFENIRFSSPMSSRLGPWPP